MIDASWPSGIFDPLKTHWAWLLFPLVGNIAQAEPPCGDGDIACWESRVAHNPVDSEARVALGLALMEQAIFGRSEAFDAALEQFEAILQIDPQHPLARVNRGLIWVHRAAEATAPAEQLQQARRGFAEMDAAVALAPDDPQVRLVRAINAYQMPRGVERRAVAGQDFAWLLDWLDTSGDTRPPLARRILFHAGSRALKERRPEAIGLLERAQVASGPRPSAAEVQSMLALAREQFTPHDDAEKEKR